MTMWRARGDDPPTSQLVAGTYLRHLREQCQLTVTEVCAQAGLRPGSLNRIECGSRRLPSGAAEMLLAGPYGVPTPVREGFAELPPSVAVDSEFGDASQTKVVDKGVGWVERLAAVENQAVAARFLGSMLIPSFLRTPIYAAFLEPPTPQSVQIPRPEVIGAQAATVVLDERALLNPVGGPAAFAAQVEHLLAAMNQCRIVLRILPLSSPAGAPIGNLTEVVLPGGTLLYVAEDGFQAIYESGQKAEKAYGGLLDRAFRSALTPSDSVARLERARDAARAGRPLHDL